MIETKSADVLELLGGEGSRLAVRWASLVGGGFGEFPSEQLEFVMGGAEATGQGRELGGVVGDELFTSRSVLGTHLFGFGLAPVCAACCVVA